MHARVQPPIITADLAGEGSVLPVLRPYWQSFFRMRTRTVGRVFGGPLAFSNSNIVFDDNGHRNGAGAGELRDAAD